MIVIKINPSDLKERFGNTLTADECCEALVGVKAFQENDIIISEAPERGPDAFDIILGGYNDGDEPHQLDLTISFDVDKVVTTEEES